VQYKILDVKWWTPAINNVLYDAFAGTVHDICIGIVAIESYEDGSWKCYIGYGRGEQEDEDCQRIAAHGMPLGSKEAACGFFPQLNSEKFVY
jgi:hypothetical protein